MYLPCVPEWHFTHHRKAFPTVIQICVHLNILQVFCTRPPDPMPLGSSSWLFPRATVPVGCSSAPPSTDLLHPELQWCWSLLVPTLSLLEVLLSFLCEFSVSTHLQHLLILGFGFFDSFSCQVSILWWSLCPQWFALLPECQDCPLLSLSESHLPQIMHASALASTYLMDPSHSVLPIVRIPDRERRLLETMQLAIGEFITDSSQGLPPSPRV